MAVQVLTPPDSSNKLQIAAAIAGNRKSKPNISIGGMDPVNVFKVWSDRDLGKKQLAQNESEGKLERENRLEIENTRVSGQIKTEQMRGDASRDIEGMRGVNEILRVQAEAQALTQSQIDVEQQTAVNARQRGLEANLSTQEMQALPLNEQVRLASLRAQDTRNKLARSRAVADQNTADAMNNITPDTVRNVTDSFGLKNMVKSPDEIRALRTRGRKDYSVNPNASKGSATSEPTPSIQRPPEMTSGDLLNTDKLGAGWATGGLPYGDSHWDDDEPALNAALKFPRKFVDAEVVRAGIKQGIEDQINAPAKVAAATVAQMTTALAPLLQNADMVIAKTHDAATRVTDAQDTLNSTAYEELVTSNAVSSAIKAHRNNFFNRTPQEIASTDPQVFLSDMLKGVGLDGDLSAAQKTWEVPEDPAKLTSWAYDGARKAGLIRKTQQALNVTADQIATFRDDRSQAEAELYRKASAALTPVYSKLAPVQAIFTQQMMLAPAELYLYAKSMMANQQSPPPPNASPIAAAPALELFQASGNNLGKHLKDVGQQLNTQGRSVSPIMQSLDGVPDHMNQTLKDIMGITVGDVPEWSINPADFGQPGRKAPDSSMVRQYFQNLTHPVDQDIFYNESMRLHEALVAGRKRFAAEQQRLRNEQAEKMKLPATGGGGGGQTSQPSKPQASQPKKPSSGGEKK